jgi:hypothetical protein
MRSTVARISNAVIAAVAVAVFGFGATQAYAGSPVLATRADDCEDPIHCWLLQDCNECCLQWPGNRGGICPFGDDGPCVCFT